MTSSNNNLLFQVKYSINPWMKVNDPVNVPKAQKQWETLKDTIEKAGAQVKVLEPHVSTLL